MLEFRDTMDKHSRNICRVEPSGKYEHIGTLLWHPRNTPRVALHSDVTIMITLSEMQEMTDTLIRLKKESMK